MVRGELMTKKSNLGNLEAQSEKVVNRSVTDILSNPEKIAEILNAFPAKLSASADKIPFKTQITAAYYAVKDPNTSIKVKATLAAALAYFILPTDLLPDFIAGLGFTDDFAVLFLVLRRLGPAITEEHYELARRRLEGEQKSSK
jgi:uncharacterized membrane protein YkvA (DUF1232 family)